MVILKMIVLIIFSFSNYPPITIMQKVVSTKNFLFIILITLFSSSCRHNNQSLNSTLSSDSLYAICERLAMQLQTDSLREMAQAYIKKTTPYSRDYFKAYQFQLLADFNAKKFDKVIESIEKAYTIPSFETFPDMAGHYQFTYARSLQYSGRSNEAIEAFKKCLNFESIDEVEKESLRIVSLNAMLQLMNTYLSNGQAEESVAFFTNLNNHPTPFIQMYNLRDVRTLLAYSLYYTDNMELAEQMIEEALSTPAYLQTPEGDFRDYSYAAAIFYGNPEKQEKVIDYCLKAIDAAKA